jgi:hypothetical protein
MLNLINYDAAERTVTTIVDDALVIERARTLAVTVWASHPSPYVHTLINTELLEQAILGAITRFVESAIDGQL